MEESSLGGVSEEVENDLGVQEEPERGVLLREEVLLLRRDDLGVQERENAPEVGLLLGSVGLLVSPALLGRLEVAPLVLRDSSGRAGEAAFLPSCSAGSNFLLSSLRLRPPSTTL